MQTKTPIPVAARTDAKDKAKQTVQADYSINAQKLVTRLEGVITRGDQHWYARCPAHEDKSPSLSVGVGNDGRILLHCFAGCPAEDVITAIGLTWRDLYPDSWEAAYRAGTANKGRKFTERLMRDVDPLEIERAVLRIALADVRTGKVLSAEDQARIEVARLRLAAVNGEAA